MQMTKNQKIGIGVGVAVVIVLIVGAIAYQNKQTQEMINDFTGALIKNSNNNNSNSDTELTKITPTVAPSNDNSGNVAKDPQNATYSIEGKNVTLINGESEDGTTTMFGEPTTGDLNGDGANDAGVILVVTGNGSGTFYYAAAALNNTTTYTYDGTNAIILGDRISPQTKDIQDQIYVVNYADRAEGEPMATDPSVGVSKYFEVNGSTLSETNK